VLAAVAGYFKNLPTATKLFILCGVFTVAIAVPIYSLVIEEKVAFDFTRKELVGISYLATLRGIYAAILANQSSNGSSEPAGTSAKEALQTLAAAEADAESANIGQTAELEHALADTLRELWSGKAARPTIDPFLVDALTLTRDLVSRVGDDSGLATDPSLDSYYLQAIIVRKLPAIIGQLGEAQALYRTTVAAGALSSEGKVRLLMLDGLLRSNAAGVQDDLAAAYRGNTEGTLKGTLDADIAAMTMTTGLYLSAVDASLSNGAADARTSALSISYSGPRWTMRSRFRRLPRLRSTGCCISESTS
jgi:hypothetical protein